MLLGESTGYMVSQVNYSYSICSTPLQAIPFLLSSAYHAYRLRSSGSSTDRLVNVQCPTAWFVPSHPLPYETVFHCTSSRLALISSFGGWHAVLMAAEQLCIIFSMTFLQGVSRTRCPVVWQSNNNVRERVDEVGYRLWTSGCESDGKTSGTYLVDLRLAILSLYFLH